MAGPVFAVDPEIVRAQAGVWLVAPADGTQGCVVELGTEEAIGGYAASEKKPCARHSPLSGHLYAWNFSGDGGIIFLSETRKVLLRLEEQEGGPFRTPADASPVMLMAKMPEGVDRVPVAQHLFGSWNLHRQSGPVICMLSLRDQPPAGGEESFALVLGQTCEASVRAIGLVSWRMEGFNLMLYNNEGEPLSFLPDGKGRFISENGKMRLQR